MTDQEPRGKGVWKYWIMIVSGVIGTLSYIGMVWAEDNTVLAVCLNICAMLGSGVLCSSIVSLIIEHNTKKVQTEEHKRQCEFIFKTLHIDLSRIAAEELRNLSEYSVLREKKEEKCWVSDNMTLSEILSKLQAYLEVLSTDFEMANQFAYHIDSEYMNSIKDKNALAFENALTYYRILDDSLNVVLEQSNVYYLAHIISENQISILKDIKHATSDVIHNSHEGDLEQTFIMKKLFFMSMQECLQAFDVDATKKIRCSYRTKKSTNV